MPVNSDAIDAYSEKNEYQKCHPIKSGISENIKAFIDGVNELAKND